MASLDTKVAANQEVGPTEVVLEALISTLVDPLLSLSVSNVPPPQDRQISVAKQMHAVVLLYNYYHRKQIPELVFLDFVSFCKMAVVVKEPLAAFIKLPAQNESAADSQLSMTEKAIKNACDAAAALDTSRDVPDIEGQLISKVAVLLIDAAKENCLLRNGFVTQGVWAPLEKEVDEATRVSMETSGQKVGRKRARSSPKVSTSDIDAYLKQLAYDAVKDAVGYDSCDLEVLETHVTYSLTKCKTATRLYMMQYSGSINVEVQVPLKLVVESLQGPLVKKLPDGAWETTPVVEYYHLLPYLAFVLGWLSRGFPGEVAIDNDVIEKHNERDGVVVHSFAKKEKESRIGEETVGEDNNGEFYQRSFSSSSRELQKTNLSFFTKTCLDSERASEKLSTNEKMNQEVRVYHNKRSVENGNLHFSEDGGGHSKVDVVDCLNLDHHLWKDKKLSRNKTDSATLFNQDASTLTGKQLVLFDAVDVNVEAERVLPESEELQNALALLYRKRQEVYSQICNREDKLVLIEDCIARIRDSGEVALARQCIKSIISSKSDLLLLEGGKQDHDKCEGKPKIYLPGKDSCQDLDYVCTKNNWRLPRYSIVPSNGKFVSQIVVNGTDFELSFEGNLESTPSSARESAAAKMISKMQSALS